MHQDITPGVMAGLAWYYLLAAVLNAAAAAYVSYMEMVSEGASRVGLAPKTRRLPDWLSVAFFGLYGLAIVMILGRARPARGARRSPTASVPWPTPWSRSPPGPTPPTSRRSGRRQRATAARPTVAGPDPRRPHPGRRPRQADQPDPLDPDLGRHRR